MHKRIIIIHPSQIIRQGLAAITRSRTNWEIIETRSCAELAHYRSIRNSSIIAIADAALAQEELASALLPFRASNSVKALYLTQLNPLLAQPSTGDGNFDINASRDHILNLLDHHFGNETIKKNPDSATLTERERDILKLVALGKSNKEMAHLLSISIHTVITHRKNITEKLNIKSISGLTVYAILNRLIDTENIDLESLI